MTVASSQTISVVLEMNLSFDYTPGANVRGFYLDISKGLDKRLYCLQFMIKTIVEMNYIIIFKKQMTGLSSGK